jgi:ligand-binding sensor domain-containing protein/signal transduction histidine kinase
LKDSSISPDIGPGPRRFFYCSVCVLVLVCFVAQMYAIDPRRSISQYMLETWGSEKGFPGGSVSAIAQTPDGYLWIGTDRGLIRFDGLNFRLVKNASPAAYPIGPVQGLESDAQGNLWILLQSTNILRYRDGKFELGRDQAQFGVTAIGTRQNGATLFSSLAYGILSYKDGKFAVPPGWSEMTNSSNAATSTQTDDTLSTRLAWSTSIASHRLADPNSAVTSMAESSDGKIWLGTRDKGLFYVIDGRVFPVPEQPSRKITCLLPLTDGLWIGTENGVLEWNGRSFTQARIPAALWHVNVSAMLRDRDSNIWLATATGLARVNGSEVSFAGGKSSELATALFEDREGNLWVGGPREIMRLRDSAFVTYSPGDLQTESGGPIYIDPDERAWFAPFDGGLHWLKDGKSEEVTNDGLNHDVVYSIAGHNNELWIGRQQGGLTHLRYDHDTIATKTYTQAEGLAQNSVYAVYLARDDSVWAATVSAGVNHYHDGHFTTYTTANGLVSDTVTAIAEDSQGTVWFATPSGVNALSHGQWKLFSTHDGLPTNDVNCLLSDATGVLWIGTSSGLAFLNSGHVQVSADTPAPLHEQILGLAEDRKGWLWIATSNHVLAAKRDKLLSGVIGEGDIREFGLQDGLRGVEGVKRQLSVFADLSGRVWFSMNHGISVVNAVRAITDTAPAIVHIDSLSADGDPIDLQRSVRVPPGGHRVTFSYTGLSLSVPERVRFRYKLDGLDRNWSDPVSTREAVYTNLGAGSYRFRVIASNSDGLWNGTESTLQFQIQPMLWQTWWFRIGSVLFLILAALLVLRLRTVRLTRQMNVRFEERLAERTRIARELHDSLLQGFQGLMFRLQAVRNLLPERPAEAVEALDAALDRADQVVAEGRGTVEDLRQSTVVNHDIVQALGALGQELAPTPTNNGTSVFRVLVEGKPRDLDPILRDEIYRIAREALRNAFHHSKAHHIEAEISYGDSQFSLRVRDDGEGIDPAIFRDGKRAGHWGLPGMRERAEQFGGHLEVWSEYGAGTEVELMVPASMAYAASARRGRFWFLGKGG